MYTRSEGEEQSGMKEKVYMIRAICKVSRLKEGVSGSIGCL